MAEPPGKGRVRGSRRGRCVGRGDRVIRRETCKWLDERALGIGAVMAGGLQVSESPLAPLKGGGQQVLWPVPAGHLAESPTARRGTIAFVGTGAVSPVFATLGSVASLAAPERPNKKS